MDDMVRELEQLKASLIKEIDEKISLMQQKIKISSEKAFTADKDAEKQEEYESIYSLTTPSAFFKGKRPTGVIFPDQTRVDVPTWKKVFEEILLRCNKDLNFHQTLMNLRGKIQGRNRVLLSNKKDKMRSPVQIDRALFAETHYDTETLLNILLTRILDEIHYDYSDIKIAIRNE